MLIPKYNPISSVIFLISSLDNAKIRVNSILENQGLSRLSSYSLRGDAPINLNFSPKLSNNGFIIYRKLRFTKLFEKLIIPVILKYL